jgi:alpha-glucosidase
VRHVTRYGGGELGTRRARAAALLMLALPGGAYVYQGEELGLPEVVDLPAEARQDPTFARTKGAVLGRDGCRVPLPWDGEVPPFGFGPSGTPWLPQPASWAALTAALQREDPTSMLALYHDALAIRHEHPALGAGTMAWLAAPPDVLAFRRSPGFACVVNLGAEPVDVADLGLAGGAVLCASAPVAGDGVVAPTAAVWLSVG